MIQSVWLVYILQHVVSSKQLTDDSKVVPCTSWALWSVHTTGTLCGVGSYLQLGQVGLSRFRTAICYQARNVVKESLRGALSGVHSARDNQTRRVVVGCSPRTDSWGKCSLSWVGAPRDNQARYVVRGSPGRALTDLKSAMDN